MNKISQHIAESEKRFLEQVGQFDFNPQQNLEHNDIKYSSGAKFVQSFLVQSQKELISKVIEMCEGKKKVWTGKEEIPNSGGQAISIKYADGYNQALSDIITSLKESLK